MKRSAHQNVGYYDEAACDIDEFSSLVGQMTEIGEHIHADDIQKNVPIYDMARVRPMLDEPDMRRALMAEWADVLLSGPGIVALKGAYADTGVLDEATAVFEAIIAEEKDATGSGGDHFAASGSNDRVWNSLQKLCLRAPAVFLRYFANPAIDAVCEAWLGPNYQMTAQVNLVHPGGKAQKAHRDYHLGFQSTETSALYPAHVHALSTALTLQGAVAHCDMPLESGPTKLLPYSQLYRAGYLAWRRDDFRDFFESNHVQLPLTKGDCVFFNPALFHAAGANTSGNIHRMANLLQVSSAFGRAMESVDRTAMCSAMYPHAQAACGLAPAELCAAVAACAEGYSFPTNLNSDPPVGGLAPESQQALFRRALDEGMSPTAFNAALGQISANRCA